MTAPDRPFAAGGWIPRQTAVPINLPVDECVIRIADAAAGRWRCCRMDPDHIVAAHPDGGNAANMGGQP